MIGISKAMRLDEFAVVGRLHRLWSFANHQSENGELRNVTLEWIDRLLGAEGFAKALIEECWLVSTDSGVEFPNFERWMSESAKKRLHNTIRQNDLREARQERDKSATKARQKRDKSATREEKRREDNKTPPPTPQKGGGGGADFLESKDLMAALSDRDSMMDQPTLEKWTRIYQLDELREILAFYDGEFMAGALKTPRSALRSMLKNPERWEGLARDKRGRVQRRALPVSDDDEDRNRWFRTLSEDVRHALLDKVLREEPGLKKGWPKHAAEAAKRIKERFYGTDAAAQSDG